MTEPGGRIIIRVEPTNGGFGADAEGDANPQKADTMHGAVIAVHNSLSDRRPDGSPLRIRVKVRETTRLATADLVGLLRIAPGAEHLDLSQCSLVEIDLSPQNLDQMSVEPELRLEGGLNLAGIQLRGAILVRANLDSAALWDTDLQDANLRDARLQEADLSGANLDGARLEKTNLCRANLRNARLGQAMLYGADFRKADLTRADLSGALLVDASFQGACLSEANLRAVHFRNAVLDDADLRGADLRDADLRSVKSLHRVRWHNARLEKTGFYPYQIEPIQDEIDAQVGNIEAGYRAAMEAYLVLKSNFTSLGTYGAAAWAYMKEQQLRKSLYFPTTAGKRWLVETLDEEPSPHWWSCSPHAIGYRLRSAWLHVWLFFGRVPPDVRIEMHDDLSRWRCARNWMYELLTGYGERPQMPVLWGLVTILVFALVFAVMGDVSPNFAGDPATAKGSHNFWDALTHSIGAFATIGFNTLEPIGRVARLLTAVESMLGIGFFALLIYTLGNRMSRS